MRRPWRGWRAPRRSTPGGQPRYSESVLSGQPNAPAQGRLLRLTLTPTKQPMATPLDGLNAGLTEPAAMPHDGVVKLTSEGVLMTSGSALVPMRNQQPR